MTARCLYLLLILIPNLCNGQIYRWVDAEGVTHFSDEPASDQAMMVELPPLPVVERPDYAPSSEELLRQSAQRERERRLAAQRRSAQMQKAAAREAEQRARCARVRERLAEIEAEMRRGYTLKRGEVLKGWLATQREREREVCAGY